MGSCLDHCLGKRACIHKQDFHAKNSSLCFKEQAAKGWPKPPSYLEQEGGKVRKDQGKEVEPREVLEREKEWKQTEKDQEAMVSRPPAIPPSTWSTAQVGKAVPASP